MPELTTAKTIAELGALGVILVIVLYSFFKGSKFLTKFFDNFLNNHMVHMQKDTADMKKLMGEMLEELKKFINHNKK